MSNNDEDSIIEQDKEQHPNCTYSRSLSTRCSNNSEGNLVCDSLRSIMRLCPGEQATNIYKYSEKTEGTNNNDDNAILNPFQFPFRGGNGGPPSLDVFFGEDDDFASSIPNSRSILDSIFSDMLKPFDKFPNVERGKGKHSTTNKDMGSIQQGPIEKV